MMSWWNLKRMACHREHGIYKRQTAGVRFFSFQQKLRIVGWEENRWKNIGVFDCISIHFFNWTNFSRMANTDVILHTII